jgi:hypothetical protein
MKPKCMDYHALSNCGRNDGVAMRIPDMEAWLREENFYPRGTQEKGWPERPAGTKERTRAQNS